MVASYGADAAIFFSELCRLAEQFKASESEFWFYASAETLIEKTGFTERKVESAIATLCKADLIMIDKRPPFNRRHFRIVQNADDFMAAISIDAQTPARAPKTAPRAKQGANTAKETPNQSERPLEMVEPVGKTEQLAAEKPKKPKANTAEIEAAAVRLIEHFNAVAGTAFRTTGKANIECFGRVLKTKEGTEEEIRMVIELKTMQWANDPKMREYLKPETLTRPSHFPKYLEECYNAKAQQSTPRPAVGNFAARDNNRYMPSSEQKKMDMILAQIAAHPGIDKHIPQQLFFPQYLASISEHEVQNQLRNARNQWTPPNFFSKTDEPPF
jgi:uncharacterized phage protein (TIGR02220 family)